MSADLTSQLADYGQYLRDHQEAIDLLEITEANGVLAAPGIEPDLGRDPASDVDIAITPPRGEDSMNLKPSTLLLLAAAAVVVIAGIFFAIESRSDDSSPVISDEVPTSTTAAPEARPATEEEARQILEAEYEAYNTGGVEARTGAGGLADHDYYSAFAAADHRIDDVECESRGFGVWSGDGGEIQEVEDGAVDVTGARLATGYGFTCQGSGSNLFHDAAALDPAITLQWVVADGQAILMADAGNEAEWFAFYEGFRRWMRLTHPDVADGMEFHTLSPTAFPTAESMATALEYVEEFVAASPDWPRSPGT